MYCSNACRQRAYRWRRDDRPQLPESELHTFRRGHGSDKAHAVRPSPDPVASRKDVRGREVTVCGAFALPARRPTWHHTDFVPDVRRSCRSCAALTDRWRGATYT